MTNRMRLLVVMTHPVQYLAPWFRYVHQHAAALDLEVVYAMQPTPEQQGIGFGRPIDWDLPLTDGYSCTVLRTAMQAASVSSDNFFGLDVPEISTFIRSRKPDVALVGGWHSAVQVRALATLRRLGVPTLYRGDSTLQTMSVTWPRLSRVRARLMLRQFAGFLAVGSRSGEYLRSMGVPDPAIVPSPHAIDVERFAASAAAARAGREGLRQAWGFRDHQKVVLFAGKLTSNKRPQDVIEATARLQGGAVLFVGEGDQRSSLQELAAARGVHAVFAGFLAQPQMAEAYVAADALMLPGRETWGLVVNEALACGLPAVTSSEAGCTGDFETPHVCVARAAGDIAQFAEALNDVISASQRDPSHRARCSAVVARHTFAEATRGLVTAATFAVRNRRAAVRAASTRVIGLCGNFVFAGGMERITFEGLSALRCGGADVHALVNGWSSRPIAELAERADASWQVGHYGARLDGVLRHPKRALRALADVLLASGHLWRLAMTRRATHVFCADFRTVLLHAPALLGCRGAGIAVVLRSGVAPTATALHRRLWRRAIRPLVSCHIANSHFTARELIAAGIVHDLITIIPNVAPSRIEIAAQRPRISGRVAYVGQVIPEKGVLPLVEAVALLAARGFDVTLDVVGQIDGWAPSRVQAYRAAIRDRIAAHDLSGRVRLLGWREDVDEVLAYASVHCCPSQPEQREGFGIAVVEAKRAGIPSVVCPSGALPELIQHRHDGWITDGFDAHAIADGLAWCLSTPETLRRAQLAARESASSFDPATFSRRWQSVFGLSPDAATVVSAPAALANWPGVPR